MRALFTLLVWAWLMASSFVVSANMLIYASPIATSVFRFILALLMVFLLLILKWKRTGLKVSDQLSQLLGSRQQCLHYIMISGALVGFFIGLFAALEYTTALNTSVLYTLVPLMGVVISRIWLNERLNFLKVGGFIIGSIGASVVLFSTQSMFSNRLSDSLSQQGLNRVIAEIMHFDWNKGDLIFLAACVLLALHVVSVQKWGRSLPPLSGAFMIMLFGSFWLVPISLIWGDLGQVQWQLAGFWVNALYLTVFATLFTFVLQQRLVVSVGASRLLAFSYTIPVWVACYTAFFHDQLKSLMNFAFIIGLLLLWLAYLLIEGTRFSKVINIQSTKESREA